MAEHRGSVGSAILWMFVLSVLLFWLPIFGPLIAGFVGGRKAGSVGNAIVAVILPGLVFGVVLFLLASFLQVLAILAFMPGPEASCSLWLTSVRFSSARLWVQ